jgi:hypothetical protein
LERVYRAFAWQRIDQLPYNNKPTLKWRRFKDTPGIKRNITKELLALHANESKKFFPQTCELTQSVDIPRGVF